MIQLTRSLNSWGSQDFKNIIKNEIEQLGVEQLPLQQGLSTGSYAMDNKLTVMIISTSDEASVIRIKAGLFYSGVIAGCGCADDPTPIDEHSEYCEVQFEINKTTADTTVTLVS